MNFNCCADIFIVSALLYLVALHYFNVVAPTNRLTPNSMLISVAAMRPLLLCSLTANLLTMIKEAEIINRIWDNTNSGSFVHASQHSQQVRLAECEC